MSTRITAPSAEGFRAFGDDPPIVARTDPTGWQVDADATFTTIAGFAEDALLDRTARAIGTGRGNARNFGWQLLRDFCPGPRPERRRRRSARTRGKTVRRVMAVAEHFSLGAGSLSADVGTFVGEISG